MHTLGVDQSFTSTAWCFVDAGNNLVEFGRISSDPSKTIYQRALDVATQLSELVSKFNITTLKIEGLAFGISGSATRDLAGLLFTIINTVVPNHPDIEYHIYSPRVVKKQATSSGKASKAEMIDALPSQVRDAFTTAGFRKTTGLSDLADAYHIAMMPTV